VKSPALIELKAAQRRHETGRLVLDDLNLRILPGEFVCLLGPPGCGKSTALRLMAGLDRPTSGEALRSGEPTRGAAGDTGFVYPQPTLMPWANVVTNVELPLRLQGLAAELREEQARAALARVGLADQAEAAPRGLADDVRLRVALARALVTQPSLLLLDDPFAALDEAMRTELQALLLALWRPAAVPVFTAVFVTDDPQEAVLLGQRVLVMGDRPGRIVDELVVKVDGPRDATFRQSATFAKACTRLRCAIDQAGAETAPVAG
jgi:NitT/TauT family transport system ATP-binding protein